MSRGAPAFVTASLLVAVALLTLGGSAATAAPKFTRVTSIGVGTFPNFGMVRTANGTLHLIFQTTAPGSAVPNGLAATSFSPSGHLAPSTQALAGWGTSRPGLVALPDGSLVAVFGAISPPPQVSGLWSISSRDGGATWSAPGNAGSGSLEALAYASDITAQLSGSTPVFTVPQAGGVVVQRGLGPGSPTELATDSTDNFAGDVDSAVDAASGEVVASWQSLAGSGGDFMRAVAPTLGAVQRAPGQVRNELVIAGRDKGPGVFAAYTPDGSHVRLLRYGGGSVAVGKLAGTEASALGVATGLEGRIWVMWGQDGHPVAVTRSNKAVTRFEPIQRLNAKPFTLYRLSGDGRLGPLDLFVDEIPTAKGAVPPAGTFHARVLPELSATTAVVNVKGKGGKVIGHKLQAKVTDAGDPVAGAKVAVKGKTAKTSASGIASLTLPGSLSGAVTVTITKPGYQALKKKIKL